MPSRPWIACAALVLFLDATARAQGCPSGRYLLDPDAVLGAVEIDGRDVGSDVCGMTTAKVRGKRVLHVRARWRQCGNLGRVRLAMRIERASDVATGTIKRPKVRPARFTARCSSCGDERLDVDGGEACDASAAGGGASCDGTCTACACVTTATTTTTTAVPTTTTTTEPDGPPITAPASTWTWVDFPDSTCDEGTPTGIGVNLTGSPNVMIYLGFGGLCWDATTCWVLNTASHGPYEASDFYAGVANVANTIFDRTLAGSPIADWNMVVVPYCTGDLHAGDNTVNYDTGTEIHVHHHAGAANLRAFLRRLGPTFPAAERVLIAGTSAGGYGAVFNYPTIRARWPGAHVDVLDDSGPLLEGAALDPTMLAAWFANWRLDLLTDPLCGLACRSDPSLLQPVLAMLHAGDRLALTSRLDDPVVRGGFGLGAAMFEAALLDMAADRLDPTSSFRYFFVAGTGHAQLVAPGSVSQNGVGLLTWLGQFLSDDPSWISVQP